jgi:hypothetical protein
MSNPKKELPSVHRQSMEEATAEAESRPMDYNPSDRARHVRSMVQDIALWMSQGDSEDVIKQRVPEFVEQYPELFKKLIQKQDMAPIQSMLTMLDRMAEGNLSQHQASVIIGKKLVDRYVTPQLNGSGVRK